MFKNIKIYPLLLVTFLALVGCFFSDPNSSFKGKGLHLGTTIKIKGWDPIFANGIYESREVARIFEGLLEYHYSQRPYTLVPNLASEMPTVSADGLTYTFKLRPGSYFHNDTCFPGGKGREMEAQDVAYSFKRVADPHQQSPGFWMLDGHLEGLQSWRDKNAAVKQTNYAEEIAGIKVLDRYTIQFILTDPFPQFLYAFAMPYFFIVPHEAVEKYGPEFMNHPIGTGPFILQRQSTREKMQYRRNQRYRQKIYGKGHRLPFLESIAVEYVPQEWTLWLKFLNKELDVIELPKDYFPKAITMEGQLVADLQQKGIVLSKVSGLNTALIAFNHANPLFKNNKLLRQAISMAYDHTTSNKLFYDGQSEIAGSIVPPLLWPEKERLQILKNPIGYAPEKAKELLAQAGYPKGKGLPEITYDGVNSLTGKQMGEFFQRCMGELGIKVRLVLGPWPDFQKRIRSKSSMVHMIGWWADYPDAENFLQIFYGPHGAPGANSANYQNQQYDGWFEKARNLNAGEERDNLYVKMHQWILDEAVAILLVHQAEISLRWPWVKNYLSSEVVLGREAFVDIDLNKK